MNNGILCPPAHMPKICVLRINMELTCGKKLKISMWIGEPLNFYGLLEIEAIVMVLQ